MWGTYKRDHLLEDVDKGMMYAMAHIRKGPPRVRGQGDDVLHGTNYGLPCVCEHQEQERQTWFYIIYASLSHSTNKLRKNNLVTYEVSTRVYVSTYSVLHVTSFKDAKKSE